MFASIFVTKEGKPMIIAVVTFTMNKKWTREEAAEVFRSTAPKYLNRPGLIRKHYFLSEGGDQSGGIYFWESKAAAEACYTPEWQAMVTEKYGRAPEIRFLETLVTVDNRKQTIEND
jgi:hypothetical protein